MLSKEFIVEVGNQPYQLPVRWRRASEEMDETHVRLPDGRTLSFYVEHEKRIALFTFLVDDEMSVTGQGDAYRIFSTAYQAVDDWVRKNRPLYFAFTSSEDDPSRIKLYDRIANRLIVTVPSLRNWVNITARQDLWPDYLEWFIDDRSPTLGSKIYLLANSIVFR